MVPIEQSKRSNGNPRLGGPRGNRRSRRGNMILESALGFLPLMALILGLMDFSLMMFLQSTFQHAVTSGVRFAVTYGKTYRGVVCSTQTSCITQAVKDSGAGFLNSSTLAQTIKVNYYSPENLDTPLTAGMLPITLSTGAKVNYVNQPGNVIEVRIQNYPRTYMAPLKNFMPGTGITINATVSDVLQGLPIGTLVPPAP